MAASQLLNLLSIGARNLTEKSEPKKDEKKDEAPKPEPEKKRSGGKVGYKAGGSVSKRADGCVTKGKTRGKIV